jgi:uncharacterized protein YqgC (DUF456 family)
VIGVFGRKRFSRKFQRQGSIVSKLIKALGALGALGILLSPLLKLNILSSISDSRLP